MAIFQSNPLPVFDPGLYLTPEKIKELAKQSTSQGYRCGISIIDQKLRGLQPACIAVTAKRGTGKSWFGLQMIHGLYKYSHEKGAFMTLEMSSDQLIRRMAQLSAGLTQDDMQEDQLATDALTKLQKDSFFTVVDCRASSFTIEAYENSVRSLVNQGYKLFVLDHINRTRESKTERWTDQDVWAERSHFLATELKITVVVMAQATKIKGKIQLEDTKGGGGTIDAVDQALTINRLPDGGYLITVEKNRLGDGQYESQIYTFTKTGQFVLPIQTADISRTAPYKDDIDDQVESVINEIKSCQASEAMQ